MNGDGESFDRLAAAERVWIVCGVVVVTALCWAYTVGLTHPPHAMAGHGAMHAAGHGAMHAVAMPHLAVSGVAETGMTFFMWCVMMAAMMLPSAIPMMLAFATINRQGEGRVMVPVAGFAAGYLGAWAIFCAGATAVQWGLKTAALLSPATLATGPVLGGALLILAGIFQWTPWKDACLKKCRNPFGFILTHWRAGQRGALRLGSSYGLYCVGCCWMLMTLSFALGVMNLAWMAILTLFMMIEKIAPAGVLISRLSGLGLAAWGGWMLLC